MKFKWSIYYLWLFLTEGGIKSTISISGVKSTLTKDQVSTLMDTIITKNIFIVNSGAFIKKDSSKLTERKVYSYEVA